MLECDKIIKYDFIKRKYNSMIFDSYPQITQRTHYLGTKTILQHFNLHNVNIKKRQK